MYPLVKGRRFLTKSVSTPGHVVPVDGDLINRYPENATLSEGKDLALVEREWNARIIEEDVKFWFFPSGSANQDVASSKAR